LVKMKKVRPKKLFFKNYHLADIGGCWRCEAAETGEQLRGEEADRCPTAAICMACW
jgi:hypothetical protein